METYQSFIFESYAFNPDTGVITLNYSLDDNVQFAETITLPSDLHVQISPDDPALQSALFALHLIAGISYYKTCIPKNIEVRSGELTEEQATFWNTVYEKGLGEFFYTNDIDFRGHINFPSEPEEKPYTPSSSSSHQPHVLVPMGGGKDSIVTMELLRKTGNDLTLLRIGEHPFIDHIAQIAELPLITIERELPASLIKLNNQGALNGHIPITAYNKFLSVVIALLTGHTAVAFSNERSANIGNTEFHGQEINHQWSKSLECETLIQNYVKENITGNVSCFSLLRSYSELRIVEEFVKYPEYFAATTSCNTNWRLVRSRPDTKWCGQCPKCAFVFALYAAFLDEEACTAVFDANLFDDATLLPLYRELLGLQGIKPFECVGTPEETTAAFLLAKDKDGFRNSVAIQMFIEEVLPNIEDPEAVIRSAIAVDDTDSIPNDFPVLQ